MPATACLPQPDSANSASPVSVRSLSGILKLPFLLYEIYLFFAGISMYLTGVVMVVPRYLYRLYQQLTAISEWLCLGTAVFLLLSGWRSRCSICWFCSIANVTPQGLTTGHNG